MVSIATLTPHINGDVITPDHPDYGKSLHRWARNAEKKAAVVVFVKDNADVSKAILFAKENNLAIAIRGGGHSATGASSVEGGLVVDLSRHLNGVRIDPVKKLAYVDGGALWETVDKAAIKYGLATVGGTVNHVCSTYFFFTPHQTNKT
jgi:FAD/FMN-containing dehydrogenase